MRQLTINQFDVPDYSGKEALNTICSNLTFSGHNVRKIVMTSVSAGEGKSYMSMHISAGLAKRSRRVVLVDADMRRSYLNKRYGLETTGPMTGLAHYLTGHCELEDALYETNLPGLSIVPIGRSLSNTLPLLDSAYFADLLDNLSSRYDYVIVDAPPVGLVIDAAEIAKYCDGAIFVAEYEKTHRRDLLEAKKQIVQSGCPILGCIINKVKFDSISARGYYNKSYYSHYNSEYYRPEKDKE